MDSRLHQHVVKGREDGLHISCVASSSSMWAVVMDAGTGFTSQVFELSPIFLHKVGILVMPVDSFAYCLCSLPVNYAVTSRLNFHFFFSLLQEWIMEQWDKNYYITSVAGASNGSALVVMSQG